jgi:hypothetical protein
MVVNRDRKLLLGLVLTDHVLIQKGLHLRRFGQLVGSCGCLGFGTIIFQNRIADCHALVANIGARIVGGRQDQLGDSIL